MEVNDLVSVFEECKVTTKYEEPDCLVDTFIGINSIGLVLQVEDDYAAVYFYVIAPVQTLSFNQFHINLSSGSFFIPIEKLRKIGETTPEQFFGHPIIDFKDVVGDSHGIWAK